MSLLSLKGKTIVVTGAAMGIGRSIVVNALKLGAIVVGVDIRKRELTELAKNVKSSDFYTQSFDITEHDKICSLFGELNRNSLAPNCLVNNAGIYYGKSIFDYGDKEIDRLININVKAALYFSKEFAGLVIKKKKRGAIVNLTSVAGQEGSSDALYGLSKAALIGLTKSNAINFAPRIRVNAVAPGIVSTDMIKSIPKYRLKQYQNKELLQNPITTNDVAFTVNFLLSDLSKNYTGAVFDINNGCYLR